MHVFAQWGEAGVPNANPWKVQENRKATAGQWIQRQELLAMRWGCTTTTAVVSDIFYTLLFNIWQIFPMFADSVLHIWLRFIYIPHIKH